MTQLHLAPATTEARAPRSPLAERVLVWAREHGPAMFWELCDALPGVSVGDVDTAAREAGALGWMDGGYVVGCSERAAEGERL